jgi:hypothetical protein
MTNSFVTLNNAFDIYGNSCFWGFDGEPVAAAGAIAKRRASP